ncbi:MAG: Ureidoglycolate lyase [Alphaproteobacteria bacterium MarineAlpha3_Bin7]|nr:MAG: Ureidoglycolate lyase [Alphaproteobacteria bacterium MarineAlpha3_Bin7]|tara:strand:- start:1549 stop:2325 length:777 start_codon:yes stop_codon:yes gene_type:complete
MAKWLRCRINGEEKVGVADGLDSVNLCEGKLFENPQITNEIVSYDDIEILTPCTPSKIIALWNNSKSNAEKLKLDKPEYPLFFIKPVNSYLPTNKDIVKPDSYDGRIVYEAELGVVIGKDCSGIEVGDAKRYIFGYTCVNDVTALSIINEDPTFDQWTRAKAFDTFCPFGPVIETELALNTARVTASLNGRVRQDYSVEDLFYKPEELVSLISRDVTLQSGDIISCGTGPGALPLKGGVTIDVSVEGIGTLSNTFSEG